MKEQDRIKKLANRPHKKEKRRSRLLARAEKLEEQARKLMVESQKARARYEHLNQLKKVGGVPFVCHFGGVLISSAGRG